MNQTSNQPMNQPRDLTTEPKKYPRQGFPGGILNPHEPLTEGSAREKTSTLVQSLMYYSEKYGLRQMAVQTLQIK